MSKRLREIWSEQGKVDAWLEVEAAVLRARYDYGRCPGAAVRRLGHIRTPTATEVAEREQLTQHDLAAFVDIVQERMGWWGRHFHLGLTSSDVVDTATALQFKRTADCLPLDGPLEKAFRQACVGKLSGAVGTYHLLDPKIEDRALRSLGLGREDAAGQVVARDRYAELLCAIALVTGDGLPATVALENVALWHERDISHSAPERIVLPQAMLALEDALAKAV